MDPITVINSKSTKVPQFYKDYVKPLSNSNLLKLWNEDGVADPKEFIKRREAIVDEMQRRKLYPSAQVHKREMESGLYPDIDDPDFATRLFQKIEFADLSSKSIGEDTCEKGQEAFDTTPVQRLIARFLHPTTQYRGVLLDHGVGVGKTCTAVTVAEMYLDLLPSNKVHIIAPVAIVDGFRRTIFDVNKLTQTSKEEFKMTGNFWKSNQCTGDTYLRLTEMTAEPNKSTIKDAVDSLIKKRYKFWTYGSFASYVKKELAKRIPKAVSAERRDELTRQAILELFSDHLIIIDEAHNLRDKTKDELSELDDVQEMGAEGVEGVVGGAEEDAAKKKESDSEEGKRLSPILEQIFMIAEGLRVMLMTATPMYNVAQEIMFLLNLLLLNDTKDKSKLVNVSQVFNADSTLIDENGSKIGEKLLTPLIRRYVSYMRGENPNSFPLRLSPQNQSERAEFVQNYPPVSLRKIEQQSKDGFALSNVESRIMGELPLMIHPARGILEDQLRNVLSKRMKGSGDRFILDTSIQLCNFVYPDKSYGSQSFTTYFEETKVTKFGAYSAKQLHWRPRSSIDSVFGLKPQADGHQPLAMHSPKIAAIVQSISAAKGMSFIYSRYLKSGALLIAIALEVAGWCRVLADGTPAPLLQGSKGDHSKKPKYILLTSDEEFSPKKDELLQYATTFANANEAAEGTKVKAIIGSQVASEGLDLKCIRELHVLDGWFHLNRLEQIIGRGVRYCSHALLPREERNCTIYLHCVSLNEFETPDLFTYRVAVQKAAPIGVISRLIKVHSWDCSLNKDAILLKGLGTRRVINAHLQTMENYLIEDRPYSGMCDFQASCNYECAIRDDAIKGENDSTQKEYDFRRQFMERFQKLVQYFEENGEIAYPLSSVRDVFFANMPWAMVAIWIRKMLNTVRIKRDDGIYGTLFVKNGYLVFQPQGVTDKMIPAAYRYGRAFGHIASSMKPTLQIEAPIQPSEDQNVSKPAVEEAPSEVLIESAMKSLQIWHSVLKKFMSTPYGPVDIPKINDQLTNIMSSMQYIYNHFGTLDETEGIGCAWWMDNIWTTAERNAVFAHWATQLDKLSKEEKFYAEQFTQNGELFKGGYFIHSGKELKSYYYNEATQKLEPIEDELLQFLISRKLVHEPVNIKEDIDAIYGFYTITNDSVVFKTRRPDDSKVGQNCLVTNLENPISRIRDVQTQMEAYIGKDDKIRQLLLNASSSDEDKDIALKRKKKEAYITRFSASGADVPDADMPKYAWELTGKYLCQYLEFVLRWMDRNRVHDKRWFLSLVDISRAELKKKPEQGAEKKKRGRPKADPKQ